MTTKAQLVAAFVSGAVPTETNYSNLISACYTGEIGAALVSAAEAGSTGIVRVVDASTVSLLANGSAGRAVVAQDTVASARSVLDTPALTSANTFVGNTQTVRSSAATGSGIAPMLVLDRVIVAAVNEVIGGTRFDGQDSAGNNQTYAQHYVQVLDPTSGSEDGAHVFETTQAGTSNVKRLWIGAGVYTPANVDNGVDTITASSIYAGIRRWRSGSGSPESAVTGSIGDLWTRTDGGATTTLYVKTSGNGTNTGWTAK